MSTHPDANIYTVARLAQVSITTVSRVLNNRPGVASETQRRVREVIDQLGYRPAVAPRIALHVGVAIPFHTNQFTDYYVGELLNGISQEVLPERGCQISLLPHHWLRNLPENIPATLSERRLDGLLLLNTNSDDEPWIAAIAATGFPHVVTGNRPSCTPYWVDADQEGGARSAVRHLIELGHTRIGFLGGNLEWPNLKTRRDAFITEMEQQKIVPRSELMEDNLANMNVQSGYDATMRLFDGSHQPPTALFASNDHLTLGAWQALEDLHLRIPDQVSIVTFDDSVTVAPLRPAVTAVRQPIRDIGSQAARCLMRLAHKQPATQECTLPLVLPTELVVRQSTAKPPNVRC